MKKLVLSMVMFGVVMLLVACVATPTVSPLVGPDGTPLPTTAPGAALEWQIANTVVSAFLVAVIPVVAVYVLKTFVQMRDRARVWLDANDLYELVTIAVKTTEALGLKGLIAGYAGGKLQYAIETTQRLLDANGIPLKVADHAALIAALIERAHSELFVDTKEE